ncbi:ROK family protein [Oceanivirga miroungae]|uniref:ROK family glucokinase n=1 Tax=Oceanivirga miroungae TaxID=1130046 RepID=A0A6I8M8I3_9FUSO|nr:ROK family protein [Oceanivirga miroungae]VWL85124.1 ROK family glucokinase [Oceanivirga miroungae]
MSTLCFDVGGMSIKYAKIKDDTSEIKIESIPTRVTENDNFILADILDVIERKLDSDIKKIAISTAGVVDSKKGEIVFAGPTIPNYTGTKIKETIEAKFSIPCIVENDVNAAAFGEYKYNKLKGDIFCMTVGTGVGGALIINDDIYTGNTGTAGEIGYMPLNNNYYQNLASTTYLLDSVEKKLNTRLNGLEIFERAKNNDKICLEAIDNLVDNLTTGMLNIIYILNPSVIVIGGGITAQKEYLENKILNSINKKIIDKKFKTEIKLAKLANSAGLYGMFYLSERI